jgi:hypothetical protein
VSSVNVLDPTIRLIVLAHMLQQFDQLDPDCIQEYQMAGFDAASIDRLRNLTTADLVRLAQHSRDTSIQISINPTKLVADMNRYEHMRADERLYEYFVRHGASLNLIMDLFTKRPSDVKRMQLMLGVTSQIGRRALPDDDTRLEITTAWHRLRGNDSWPYRGREHFRALHEAYPTLTIAQLEAVIASFKVRQAPGAGTASGDGRIGSTQP